MLGTFIHRGESVINFIVRGVSVTKFGACVRRSRMRRSDEWHSETTNGPRSRRIRSSAIESIAPAVNTVMMVSSEKTGGQKAFRGI